MNNKEKYIAEVDSLKAGSRLRNAIAEKADIKPKKNYYKMIIPFAACIVIAVLISLPGFVFRAGRAKSAADEVAYENAAVVDEEAGFADAKSEYNYVDSVNKGSSDPGFSVLITCGRKILFVDDFRATNIENALNNAVRTGEPFDNKGEKEITVEIVSDKDNSSVVYSYYRESGVIIRDNTVYILNENDKNFLEGIIPETFTD